MSNVALRAMVSHPKRPISKRELVHGPRAFGVALLAAFLVAMMVNFGFAIRQIVRPPHVVLESPSNGELRHDPLLEIRGKTEVGAKLSLNGQSIVTGLGGEFRELLSLQEGMNTVKLSAKKRYSRTRELNVQVLYEPNRELTINNR